MVDLWLNVLSCLKFGSTFSFLLTKYNALCYNIINKGDSMASIRDEFNNDLETVLNYLGQNTQLVWDIYWCMSLKQAEEHLKQLMKYYGITLEEAEQFSEAS